MTARDVFHDLLRRADDRLLAGWYRAVSVPAWQVRRQLVSAGLSYLDPVTGQGDLVDLDRAALWLIDQAGFGASALGGIGGLGGLASVPPEALAHVVAVVRLGQRLGVVYGFDPSTDRGRMALIRAIASGYEVELPEGGPVGLRISDLPSVVAPALMVPRTVGSELLGTVLRKTAWTLARRISRIVPVASAGLSAAHSRKNMTEIGTRMQQLFRKLAEVRPPGMIEEAIEVG